MANERLTENYFLIKLNCLNLKKIKLQYVHITIDETPNPEHR
jgi:hypothetical protein